MRNLNKTLLFCVLFMLLPKLSYAYWDLGFSGIYDYSRCSYGNVVGRHYINNLEYQLGSSIHGYPVGNTKFKYLDNNAWEKHLVNSSNGGNGAADSVHFYAYAGHGRNFSTYAAPHFNSYNGTLYNHSSLSGGCDNDYINAATFEINWGANKLRWALMQTCNFLNYNDLSGNYSSTKHGYLKNIFKGLGILMGFRTTMFMHSDEGTTLGKKIFNHGKLVNSFFDSAYQYQSYRFTTPIYATAMGYESAVYNDNRNTSPSKAPNWDDSTFIRINKYIPPK